MARTHPSRRHRLKTAALIVAAGRGTGLRGLAEAIRSHRRVPVLTRTLGVFLDHPSIDLVQVVIAAGDEPLYAAAIASLQKAGCLHPSLAGDTPDLRPQWPARLAATA